MQQCKKDSFNNYRTNEKVDLFLIGEGQNFLSPAAIFTHASALRTLCGKSNILDKIWRR
jgi:hypothetical protein